LNGPLFTNSLPVLPLVSFHQQVKKVFLRHNKNTTKGGETMRYLRITALTLIVALTLLMAGCNLFSEDRTRPAPVRPNQNQTQKKMNNTTKNPQSPTKNIPGTESLSEEDLLKQISTIEQAVKKKDWDTANREGNELGVKMARYRPDEPDGKSLREMTAFDLIYTKLQTNLKTKNQDGCLSDLQNLRKEMKKLNKTSNGG